MLVTMVLCLCAGAIAVRRCLTHPAPLVHLSAFRQRNFALGWCAASRSAANRLRRAAGCAPETPRSNIGVACQCLRLSSDLRGFLRDGDQLPGRVLMKNVPLLFRKRAIRVKRESRDLRRRMAWAAVLKLRSRIGAADLGMACVVKKPSD